MGVYLRDKIYWMCYKLPSGEYIRKSTDTENKKVAEAIYQKQAVAIAENKHLDVKRESKLLFEELSALFLERHSKPKKKSWKTSDTVYIRRLNLFFGKIPIAKITQETLEEYLAGRQSKPMDEDKDGNKRYLKPATLNRELSCLRTMFNKAIEWGKLDKNPCARIKKLREDNKRDRFLGDKEITQLLECASPKLGEVITILVNTGMRKGELGSLQWTDLDFDTNQIRLGNTKSGKTRFIPMNQTVKQVLLRRRIKKENEVLVFQGKEGKPWDFRLPFMKACEKAAIKNLKIHDLRHTFASHLCMKGADLMTVKELLGHSSLTMTQRYSHLTDRHKAEAVARLDTLSSSHVTIMSQSDKNKSSEEFKKVVSDLN